MLGDVPLKLVRSSFFCVHSHDAFRDRAKAAEYEVADNPSSRECLIRVTQDQIFRELFGLQMSSIVGRLKSLKKDKRTGS